MCFCFGIWIEFTLLEVIENAVDGCGGYRCSVSSLSKVTNLLWENVLHGH